MSGERRRRFWFNEPWQYVGQGERVRAMEVGVQIIFFDLSAVRFNGVSWVRDDQYLIQMGNETEADRFLVQRLEEAAKAANENNQPSRS